eukprot:3296830-Rhodomonas_salina.1
MRERVCVRISLRRATTQAKQESKQRNKTKKQANKHPIKRERKRARAQQEHARARAVGDQVELAVEGIAGPGGGGRVLEGDDRKRLARQLRRGALRILQRPTHRTGPRSDSPG